MEELRDRLKTARPSNWEHWPTVRELWPWFAALGIVALVAVPWGIRAEERSLEAASRAALTDAGYDFEDISFTGRQATIAADLSTNEQIGAVAVLAELGGVSRVTWQEPSSSFVPATATPPVSTTTPPRDPGAHVTVSATDGRITLRGVVPTAQTIKELNDAAQEIWGSGVVNQLFVDATVIPHPWLAKVDDAVAVLAGLIDPQLTLDYEGATITGEAINQTVLDSTATRLSEALGEDTAIDNKVNVTSLELPSVQIISPGDGTVEIMGTVTNPTVRRSILQAVSETADELDTTGSLAVTDTTADVYLLRRLPEVIAALAGADQWTLRFDGESLGGAAVGGKTFAGIRVKPTAQTAQLLELLSSFLEADPHLRLEIEIHALDREDINSTNLARLRAEAVAEQLVRFGVDPLLVTVADGPGDGDLLRFMLIPADN